MRQVLDLVRSKADVTWLVAFLLVLGAGGAYVAISLVGEDARAGEAQVEFFTTVVTNELGETETVVTRKVVTPTATRESVGTVIRPGTTVFGPTRQVAVTGPAQTRTDTLTLTQTATETSVRTVTETLTNTVTDTIRDTVTVVQTDTVTITETVTVMEPPGPP
jgi:hypothetical protein